MITAECIARINELAKKSRETGLTDNERAEQTELRRRYIEHIKGQVKVQLDSIKVVDHGDQCGCGCHDKH
ncbi:conserved hypothetical protein [uncultured Sporomusa sp.]|uniref:UPF0291 protein KL86SPO_30037 n=1 Tax=uncultured Sporomusa sp. TaxID=307249 RepID=A0A212LQB4_9FIRM|nr:DUF896 domain-containing protein [uncultured Sporomusa sp.]SCM79671.1 conserved hypothetical protein [uncultured Sporomusa sp.]